MRPSAVFTTRDFDIAELSGLRLLGVLRSVGESWVAAGEPLTLETRADVVAATLVPRQIADRWTAAWVWGAVDALRTPYESCVVKKPRTPARRRRSGVRAMGDAAVPAPPGSHAPVRIESARLGSAPSRVGIRELDLWKAEVAEIRDLRLTSPMRTALDLLREAPDESGWAAVAVRLLRLHEDPAAALEELKTALGGHRFAVRAQLSATRLHTVETLLLPAGGRRRDARQPAETR